jgi:hypothetical protein
MRNPVARSVVAVVIAAAGVGAAILSVTVEAQSAREQLRARVEALPGTPAIKAFIASRIAKGYTPPKTPWGDPDISGVFDTSPEANTPMERPDEWAGRKMDGITPAELAAAIAKRQQNAVEQAPFAGGGEPDQGIAIAVPIHWFDNLNAVNARPWFVIDPSEGKIPPPTDAARQRRAAAAAAQAQERKAPDYRPGGTRDNYVERNSGERCITFFGGAWRTPIIYGNAHQLVQTPDYVVFRSEMVHEARIIPLDGRAHAAPSVKTHFGDSRGYWDGNSLVVETTNIHPDMTYYGAPGTSLRVVERFTRISPDKVEWTVTLDDATTWVRAWTYSYPMTINESKPIFEYACHEGNFGMANLLSAGRLADKQGGFGTERKQK